MPYNIPIGNSMSNQLFATGSTVDLLKWDENCLDSMIVPEGIERTDVINCILEKYGDETLAHPDPVYMKHYVGTWSKRRLPIWIKLLETVNYVYNPIHNYDRSEEITETTNKTSESHMQSSDTGTSTVTGSINRSESSENKVSAENVDTYQPNELTDNSIGENTSQETSTTATANDSGSGNETVTYTHKNTTKGNIGVTTTQQMIEDQRKIVRYSVIEEIAADYRDAFCLGIY